MTTGQMLKLSDHVLVKAGPSQASRTVALVPARTLAIEGDQVGEWVLATFLGFVRREDIEDASARPTKPQAKPRHRGTQPPIVRRKRKQVK